MKALRWLNRNIEYVGMCITFCIMFTVVLLGIITRAAGHPISWTEEASRLSFVWMIFLGLSYGTTHDKHIRVTIIPDKMGPRVAAAFTIFWDIITIIVFAWISFYGCRYVIYSSTAKTFALQLNKGLVATIIPASAALNIFRNLQKMFAEHIPAYKEAAKEAK